MRHTDLGATGLTVGELTLGTSALGKQSLPGSPEEAEAVRVAAAFLTGPIPLIDTSNNYGDGRSETVLGLGLGLAAVGSRATARIATKVDRDPVTGAFGRDRVLRSYEESLARLGLDRVEILHFHDPYSVTFAEATAPGGAVDALRELRDSGAVDAIGIAAGPIPLMTEYLETGLFDVVLSHNRYTLVDRSAEALFTEARRRGMGVFNAAPFGAGILAKGANSRATYGYVDAPPELVAWIARAEEVCADHGVPLAAAALHFSLRSPLVDSTIVGIASIPRLEQLLALHAVTVPDALWVALDGLGAAPTPLAAQDAQDARDGR
ncbi:MULTISPECIES: aldo/keto reductase [unclassified Microbacterium]|uniref:aldo/keto reductase n=1 Tax=unclassified Microbacterium TaxID=2609290 RepID=UPI00214B1F03|nr:MULTISPECIES: aldo/keto reductase [unclassified Microbacterium]MCR2783436.1 aldo/keto reductase [Microbacterium sp. zg.B96]WIM15696.1 aldo/keto reductase [Microbacterium sp. zg-B96]